MELILEALKIQHQKQELIEDALLEVISVLQSDPHVDPNKKQGLLRLSQSIASSPSCAETLQRIQQDRG